MREHSLHGGASSLSEMVARLLSVPPNYDLHGRTFSPWWRGFSQRNGEAPSLMTYMREHSLHGGTASLGEMVARLLSIKWRGESRIDEKEGWLH